MINLGDQPIIEDEAIRSIVAFEMHKSGDYITPTIGGEPYLRKPPLYNWLIAGSFSLFGNYSETAIRFPMIISLLLFSLLIFWVVRKELGTRLAVLNMLIYLTLGRIIMYESLHGLIDIAFSMLTYLVFMLSWFLFKRKDYLWLFLLAYFLTTITWMMKGLPSLVFLGTGLLVLFISGRRFIMLFNWRHFAGIFLLIILLGAYYLVYFNRNDISAQELFMTLLGQTTRRTVIRFGWWETILHLFTFPLEMLYHFLPWSLLTLVLFVRGTLKKIWQHRFLRYNLLLLVFNLIPYWTSPEVHARYILMLVPLYFTIVSRAFVESRPSSHILNRIVEYILGAVLVIASIAPLASPYIGLVKDVDHVLIISILISMAMIPITIFYWRNIKYRLFWFSIGIFILRIGFDFLVLPTRQMDSKEVQGKANAIALAEMTKGHDLYSYWNPAKEPHFYYLKNLITFRYHYYLSTARNEMVVSTSEKIPGAIYFSNPQHIGKQPIDTVGTLTQYVDGTRPLVVFRFTEINSE